MDTGCFMRVSNAVISYITEITNLIKLYLVNSVMPAGVCVKDPIGGSERGGDVLPQGFAPNFCWASGAGGQPGSLAQRDRVNMTGSSRMSWLQMEFPMGKEQRNEKMSKKPKKDTSEPKGPATSDRPSAPMTTVMPRGKEKKK